MRSPLVLVLACALGAAELRPLLDRSSDQAEVLPALMQLSKGDAGPLSLLQPHHFQAEVGRSDPERASLVRRWTEALPQALDRLDPTQRRHAVAAMEARFQILVQTVDEHERLALATAFLPAPGAVAIVQAAADAAFDRGNFRSFAAWSAILSRSDDPRLPVADQLGGFAALIDPSLALAEPGPLLSTAAPANDAPRGIRVRWGHQPGWLLAADPLGRVRWQERLDADAVVVAGDGGAVISDLSGIRFLDEHGGSHPLPPLPSSGRILSVAGEAAWFAVGTRIHRWHLDNGLSTVDIGEVPLTAPLVRGQDSLWLGDRSLILVRGERVVARFAHGRAVDSSWRLADDEIGPLLIAPDQRSERITAMTDALELAEPETALDLLLRAGRPAEVIARRRDDPLYAEIGHGAELRARLMLGGDAAALDLLPPLARTHADQALLWSRFLDHPQALAWRRANPEAVLAPGSQDVLANADDWTWRVRADVYRDPPSISPIGLDPVQSAPQTDAPHRLPDGGWAIGDLTWRFSSDVRRSQVSCHDSRGERWRRWWPASDILSVPSRQFVATHLHVIVVEGTKRILAFNADDGRLTHDYPLTGHDVTATEVALLDDGIAVLHPPWLHSSLHRLTAEGWTQVDLPKRARWCLGLGTRVLIASIDGKVHYLDGAVGPSDLGGERPLILATGLYRSASLWPWVFSAP